MTGQERCGSCGTKVNSGYNYCLVCRKPFRDTEIIVLRASVGAKRSLEKTVVPYTRTSVSIGRHRKVHKVHIRDSAVHHNYASHSFDVRILLRCDDCRREPATRASSDIAMEVNISNMMSVYDTRMGFENATDQFRMMCDDAVVKYMSASESDHGTAENLWIRLQIVLIREYSNAIRSFRGTVN